LTPQPILALITSRLGPSPALTQHHVRACIPSLSLADSAARTLSHWPVGPTRQWHRLHLPPHAVGSALSKITINQISLQSPPSILGALPGLYKPSPCSLHSIVLPHHDCSRPKAAAPMTQP
jgi:hypothetical protein